MVLIHHKKFFAAALLVRGPRRMGAFAASLIVNCVVLCLLVFSVFHTMPDTRTSGNDFVGLADPVLQWKVRPHGRFINRELPPVHGPKGDLNGDPQKTYPAGAVHPRIARRSGEAALAPDILATAMATAKPILESSTLPMAGGPDYVQLDKFTDLSHPAEASFGDAAHKQGSGNAREGSFGLGHGNYTPLVVLFVPKVPSTSESRAHKVVGDVVLEAVLTANGEVKVLRVVRSLGYGLDEAAQSAAKEIIFKPAELNGAPVDSVRIIRLRCWMAP